jgi:hypothetical protein
VYRMQGVGIQRCVGGVDSAVQLCSVFLDEEGCAGGGHASGVDVRVGIAQSKVCSRGMNGLGVGAWDSRWDKGTEGRVIRRVSKCMIEIVLCALCCEKLSRRNSGRR